MSIRRWTEAEDARLREVYGDSMRPSDAALHFGRTLTAIHMRAHKLGLCKKVETGEQSPTWISIKRICEDGKPRTYGELAILLGVTQESIAYLFRSRKSNGLAHIATYKKVRGRDRAHWLPIPGEDAPYPSLSRNARKAKRYRARKPIPAPDPRQAAPATLPDQHEIIRALFGMGAAA